MIPADVPANEGDRLRALKQMEVLDTGAEERFDRLTRLAQDMFKAPIALVSLVDSDRQWFKSNIGLPGVTETPREVAFCHHAIQDGVVFEVPDAQADPRFRENPLVSGDPNIRFYAGSPIETTAILARLLMSVVDGASGTRKLTVSRASTAAGSLIMPRALAASRWTETGWFSLVWFIASMRTAVAFLSRSSPRVVAW